MAAKKNAQHSSGSAEWFTNPEIVAAARATMGGIDLDPASCALANRTVRARRYFTKETNGLAQVWGGRVFLNPPGGIDDDRESLARRFWRSLAKRYVEGELAQAYFVGFSIEILQRAQNGAAGYPIPTNFPMCIPRDRPEYLKPIKRADLTDDTQRDTQPTHAGCLIYLPPMGATRPEWIARFAQHHTQFGAVFNLGGA